MLAAGRQRSMRPNTARRCRSSAPRRCGRPPRTGPSPAPSGPPRRRRRTSWSDAAHIEAGAAEHALLADRHLLLGVALVENRVARTGSDDGDVEMLHKTLILAPQPPYRDGRDRNPASRPTPEGAARGSASDRNTSCLASGIGTTVVRLPMQPAHRAIWVTSRTASPRCMVSGLVVSGTLWSERRIRFGTPTSSRGAGWPGPPHGVDPAEGHREPAQRLPLQVVLELAVVIAVQGQPVAALSGAAHHPGLADPRHGPDGGRGHPGPQDRRPLQVEPRAVEHQPGHPSAAVAPRRRSRSSHSDTISPPAECPHTRTAEPGFSAAMTASASSSSRS